MGGGSKKKGGAGGGSSAANDDTVSGLGMKQQQQDEQPLQAVLLVDDWDVDDSEMLSSSDVATTTGSDSFYPLLYEIPKVLLPVLNVPMIQYSINFLLEQCDVDELYIVCSSVAVENYIRSNTNTSSTAGSSIHIIRDNSIMNAGDALRELDRRNIIQSDPFVLCWGDVITNCNYTNCMQSIIQQHRIRRQHDTAAIMTCTFVESNSSNRNNPNNNNAIVGIDPSHENRILFYDSNGSQSLSTTTTITTKIPCSYWHNSTSIIQLRTDLIDTGIDICSPDVLARFSDEFDYRTIRSEFVTNSAAEEEEGLQNKIYSTILRSSGSSSSNGNYSFYANRIRNWETYNRISHDMLQRFVYPVVPDAKLASLSLSLHASSLSTRYTIQPHYLYIESIPTTSSSVVGKSSSSVRNPVIGRTSIVRGPGMIGINSCIGENCTIEQCVIGKNCTVQDNVTISKYCHLWDNVTIESNVRIESGCLIANNVIIKTNTIVRSGCIIGPNCIIGTNITLPAYSRITLHTPKDDDNEFGDDDEEEEDDDEFEEDEDDEEEDGEAKATNENVINAVINKDDEGASGEPIGVGGKGRIWVPSSVKTNDDDDDWSDDDGDDKNDKNNEQKDLEWLQRNSILGSSSIMQPTAFVDDDDEEDGFSNAPADDDEGDDDDDDDADMDAVTPTIDVNDNLDDDDDDNLFSSGPSDPRGSDLAGIGDANAGGGTTVIGRTRGLDVVKELKMICLEYDETGTTPIENLIIELNSFKFSQNATYAHCTKAATLAIIEKMQLSSAVTDGKLVGDWKSALKVWKPLFSKMTIGLDEEKAIVYALDECATGTGGNGSETTIPSVLNRNNGMTFRLLLQTLHDSEIVSEESILAWAADNESIDPDSPRGQLFFAKPIQEFLEWLEEDSDDDDEDDEGDDEDEDDDDE